MRFGPEFMPSGLPNDGNGPAEESTEDLAEPNGICSTDSAEELSTADYEKLKEELIETLDTLGLYDAGSLTVDALSRLGPEILGHLNSYTAESLYFDTFRRSRKWLGNEPIGITRFLNQAVARHQRGDSLTQVQLLQRMKDVDFLGWAGIDQVQITRMLFGHPAKKQNVNRLSFLLFDEPKLRSFANNLHDNAELEGPYGVEEIVTEAKQLLIEKLGEIKKLIESSDATDDPRKKLDSIGRVMYNRVMYRMDHSIALAELIVKDLKRETTLEEFIEENGPFGH